MLQDTTYPPEIFLPLREGEEDIQEDGEDIDYAKLRERGVVFAVGVPGESEWVEKVSFRESSGLLSGIRGCQEYIVQCAGLYLLRSGRLEGKKRW